jgi:hypothetical protein
MTGGRGGVGCYSALKIERNKFIVQSNFIEQTDVIGKVELIDIDYV